MSSYTSRFQFVITGVSQIFGRMLVSIADGLDFAAIEAFQSSGALLVGFYSIDTEASQIFRMVSDSTEMTTYLGLGFLAGLESSIMVGF